jgi:hypothetical protein
MSGNRKPKFNYKIFNKKTGKYLSSNSKGTWTSRTWVVYNLPANVNDYDIHVFPVSNAIVVPAKDFIASLRAEQEEEKKRKDKKKISAEEKKRQEKLKMQYLEDLQKYRELKDRIERYENNES